MAEWQPIETVPDGLVIVQNGEFWLIDRYTNGECEREIWERERGLKFTFYGKPFKAAKWMPK